MVARHRTVDARKRIQSRQSRHSHLNLDDVARTLAGDRLEERAAKLAEDVDQDVQ